MEWTDTAFILRIGQFREADLWVRLLVRGRGLVTAFAFGGSRSRRRFCGCLDVFNLLSCRCKTTVNGQYLNLEEAVLLRGPQRPRADWRRMGIAANCARFTEILAVSRDSARAAYSVFGDLLDILEREDTPPVLLPLLFRLRMASELGFAPDFTVCASCGAALSDLGGWFLVDEGGMRCTACDVRRSSYALALPPAGVALLRSVRHDPLDVCCQAAASLSPGDRKACARVIDAFVQYHLGIAWEEGRFRRV